MKWTPNGTRVHDNHDGWCGQCYRSSDATKIADRHNADIAELTAERDAALAKLDRLAASGALVPVKVGDPVALDCVKTNCIVVNGDTYMCNWDGDWCGIADTTPYLYQAIGNYDEATLIVQPVRLVPLKDGI